MARSPLQLVLDFFTGGPVSPAAPAAAPPSPANPAPQTGHDALAPASMAPPPREAPPGPAWVHPLANRELMVQGMRLGYRFERSRRRTIGLTIAPEGLVVRAPGWVPLREVDAAVHERGAWVLAKLQAQHERRHRALAQALRWEADALVPYVEGPLRLALAQGRRSGLGEPEPGVTPGGLPVRALYLNLPPLAGTQQIRESAEAWLRRQARPLFEARLNHFAPQLGVQWQRLSLSSARTRWGSASSDGHIRLNWRLVHLPLAQLDYVVVHELAHLRVMNHSPRFWDTVGEVMPDWRERRARLRESPLAVLDE